MCITKKLGYSLLEEKNSLLLSIFAQIILQQLLLILLWRCFQEVFYFKGIFVVVIYGFSHNLLKI